MSSEGVSPVDLRVVVVNNGNAFEATITTEDTEESLEKKLLPKLKVQDHERVTIYAAKTSTGSWLALTKLDYDDLRKSRVPDKIRDALISENHINLPFTSVLQSKLTGHAEANALRGEVHLLVLIPGPLGVNPKWLCEQHEPTYALDHNKVKFVNRDDTVQTLLDVHFSNYNGKISLSRYEPWQIPLADNLYGLGKTEFGLHYINQCRKILNNPHSNLAPVKKEFMEELCTCRTIRIDVYHGAFVGQEPHFNVVNKLILNAVVNQLDPNIIKPGVLMSKAVDTQKPYVEHLAEALGPLFIVIDEAGRGFDDPRGELASEKLFVQFSNQVLLRWCKTSKVHFVVMGYAQIMRSIKPCYGLYNYFIFSRLPLRIMRPDKIKLILSETRSSFSGSETLQQRWGLSSELELENAAQFLFMASAGIPRTIVRLLIDHPTYSGFVEFVKNGHDLTLRLEDWEEVYRNILLWQSTLLEWIGKDIDECPTINMFDSVEDNEGKEVQPTLVLGSCYLNWEGTMDRAHVFADQTIWHVAIGILRPLQQYVRGLAKALPFMTAEHPEILEWLILKRVKELFTEETTPKKMLPSFFGKVTCFDLVEGINISKYVDVLPQITTGCEYDSQNVSTSTNTDRPSDKPMLMEYILNRLWIEQIPYDQGLCFKSIYKPSPADVIFVAQRNCSFMSEPKPKKRRSNPTKHIFFFGLTVLNCTTGKHDIVEECAKFDKMLQELHQMRDTLGSVTTSGVLVLCAAKYTREIQRSFKRRDSVVFTTPQVCQNVEQVLLLNLSTPELRARFFGFEDEPALKRTVEDIFLRSGSA